MYRTTGNFIKLMLNPYVRVLTVLTGIYGINPPDFVTQLKSICIVNFLADILLCFQKKKLHTRSMLSWLQTLVSI